MQSRPLSAMSRVERIAFIKERHQRLVLGAREVVDENVLDPFEDDAEPADADLPLPVDDLAYETN